MLARLKSRVLEVALTTHFSTFLRKKKKQKNLLLPIVGFFLEDCIYSLLHTFLILAPFLNSSVLLVCCRALKMFKYKQIFHNFRVF